MAAVYDASPAYMEIKTFYGNDDAIVVTFPFDHTSYTFSGFIYDASGKLLVTMGVAKSTGGAPYTATFTVSSANNQLVTPGSLYVFKWAVSGQTRTFATGPFTVGAL